ncbi:hypothetical protein PGTUg99_000348 [Puccinia graminis f. sp. tritici]|uniref:Uncharacterized protein n=1 Tax=Puccinia graminis f. sp. tritici TaxID=56615 RepID=A0A5B0S2K3_PUCGR|nr:hypothetical protein PGTUg99_000348 [Puccinia graminis f. sp. tritici]
MAAHERSGTISYEELCEIYSKEIIDQATRPGIEDDEDVPKQPTAPDTNDDPTYGTRSTVHPPGPLYICIPPAAREWSWGGFQRGVIRSLVSHNLEVGHEIRCNHAAGELVWQMYRGLAARPTPDPAPSLICGRSWPASVRRILRTPHRFRLHIMAPDGPWQLDPEPSVNQQATDTPLMTSVQGDLTGHISTAPTPLVWPSRAAYATQTPPPGEIIVPRQVALTPAKLTRLVFFHLSRERRSIHVDRVAQDADATKSLQWHFTIIEPGQAPALGSFMRGEGCFEDFVNAVGASSPLAKVVIRLYMQYDDRHLRPLPPKERRYLVIGPGAHKPIRPPGHKEQPSPIAPVLPLM